MDANNYIRHNQWKYDHELTVDEIKDELFFNNAMTSSSQYQIQDGNFTDIYWLLTEWRKNTSQLKHYKQQGNQIEYEKLLSFRAVLNYALDIFNTNYVTQKQMYSPKRLFDRRITQP